MPSANTQRGEVTIKLGGHEWVMVPEFEVCARIESRIGRGLFEVAGDPNKLTLSDLAWIISEAIKGSDAKRPPDFRTAGEWIMAAGMTKVLPVVTTFIGTALTSDEELAGADEGNGEGAPESP